MCGARLGAWTVGVSISLLTGTAAFGQTVHYVDVDAATCVAGDCYPDGVGWCNATADLKAVLDVALPGDEIRVAQGTYLPSSTPARSASFQVDKVKTLKGGYAGCGEPDPNARVVDLFETILSGDLADDDVGELDDPSHNENSYHVVVFETARSMGLRSLAGERMIRITQMSYGVVASGRTRTPSTRWSETAA